MPKKNSDCSAPNDPAESKPEAPSEATAPTEREPQERRIERRSPPNHIYVGKKPVMSYAMSALIQLTQSEQIIIKARGMAISRAVDVAEIVSKRLGNNAFSVKDIKIDTELVGVGEEARNVSTIEIVVGKK
ncbi:MAG: DNA-binding protein Alba [archaeon]|nr:DNA-binding protein Alba [archaeon]MCP8314065.1 DNA-binding protein Alba [archaeon]MCP8315909.1 DNA-binding protein Alba [archaeon]MCP8320600.1 DNA-binding protein Alba [archaeon]